jgi:hypothetical protein
LISCTSAGNRDFSEANRASTSRASDTASAPGSANAFIVTACAPSTAAVAVVGPVVSRTVPSASTGIEPPLFFSGTPIAPMLRASFGDASTSKT